MDRSVSFSRDVADNDQKVHAVQSGNIDSVLHGSETESAMPAVYLAMKELIEKGYEITVLRPSFNYPDMDKIESDKSIIVLSASPDPFLDLPDSTKAVNSVITDDLSGNIPFPRESERK
ncbi:MAG: hypothetical protein ACP5NK_05950 [Thermoplasmata archaeon]